MKRKQFASMPWIEIIAFLQATLIGVQALSFSDGYQPYKHSRLYGGGNRAFIAQTADLSGIGKKSQGTGDLTAYCWGTMISSRCFLTVKHFAPRQGETLRFYHSNSPYSSYEEAVVETLHDLTIGIDGLTLGRLVSAPSASVKRYPVPEFEAPNVTFKSPTLSRGARDFVVGQTGFGTNPTGEAAARDVAVGTTTFLYTESNSYLGGLSQDPRPDVAGTITGDSGGPTLGFFAGSLCLLGIHIQVNNDLSVSGHLPLIKTLLAGFGETVQTIAANDRPYCVRASRQTTSGRFIAEWDVIPRSLDRSFKIYSSSDLKTWNGSDWSVGLASTGKITTDVPYDMVRKFWRVSPSPTGGVTTSFSPALQEFKMAWTPIPGISYKLESSPDLLTWTTQQWDVSLATTTLRLSFPEAPSVSSRFFSLAEENRFCTSPFGEFKHTIIGGIGSDSFTSPTLVNEPVAYCTVVAVGTPYESSGNKYQVVDFTRSDGSGAAFAQGALTALDPTNPPFFTDSSLNAADIITSEVPLDAQTSRIVVRFRSDVSFGTELHKVQRFAIRRSRTISDLFHEIESPDLNGDEFHIYNNATQVTSAYWYADVPEFVGWYDANGNPSGGVNITLGMGTNFRRTKTTSKTFFEVGHVKSTVTGVKVYGLSAFAPPGATRYNWFSAPMPFGIPFQDSLLPAYPAQVTVTYSGAGLVAGPTLGAADEVQTWYNGGTLSFFHHDAVFQSYPPVADWRKSDGTPANSTLLPAGRSIMIVKKIKGRNPPTWGIPAAIYGGMYLNSY
ncbi:MAG: hypothetical protein V4675_01160 [Verrucomicrobiota bacterium]